MMLLQCRRADGGSICLSSVPALPRVHAQVVKEIKLLGPKAVALQGAAIHDAECRGEKVVSSVCSVSSFSFGDKNHRVIISSPRQKVRNVDCATDLLMGNSGHAELYRIQISIYEGFCRTLLWMHFGRFG